MSNINQVNKSSTADKIYDVYYKLSEIVLVIDELKAELNPEFYRKLRDKLMEVHICLMSEVVDGYK